MGQVHGARAALRRFRRQGSGVLINMSSVWGRITTPQVTPYIVSKNAVRAFSECLTGELADEEGRALEILYAVAPPLYRRLTHSAFVRGTRGSVSASPAPGNVLASRGPHRVQGGWHARRQGALRRAFLAAAVGAVSGFLKKKS